MKSNEERLQDLLAYVDSLTRVHPSEIPGIDLYMDQVTTFMDSHLNTSKWLGEDKILTKTMINNYAKNNLLPPPVKKRYSKNHLLMLILIYYFKNVISFRDIEQLFSPISEHHFSHGSSPELEELHNEIFSLEKGQTPLESAVVYERLSLPENSGLVCGAQLGMTGGAASRLFFAEAMEYNRPMRSFLLVELDRSAIRNQIALLRTDDMLSLSIRGADRELAGISFTARAAEADYTNRSV